MIGSGGVKAIAITITITSTSTSTSETVASGPSRAARAAGVNQLRTQQKEKPS